MIGVTETVLPPLNSLSANMVEQWIGFFRRRINKNKNTMVLCQRGGENHPVYGESVASLRDDIKPLLANCID